MLTVLGSGSALALAGCLGGDDDDDAVDDEEVNDDLSSLEPGPEGQAITEAEIATLVEIFDDEPTNADQREIEGEQREYTPRHVWKWVSDETFIGLHFDDPNPEEATAIDYILIGQKGLFTEENQPDAEFTHFHQHTADGWEAGHGGETGDEGYWLTHIAAREIEYPFHDEPIGPQVDYGFMPTPPEEGSEGHDTDWEAPDGGEGGLSAEDRDALLEVFDFDWTSDDQREVEGEERSYTPSHVFKDLTEDTLMFLHFDDPNPEEAENLIYFGLGIRGQFTDDDRPDGPPESDEEDFTHFHKWEGEGWEAGHGGQDSDQHGYWLVHHAVRPLEMDWGDVEVGVDREFMPTPPDE